MSNALHSDKEVDLATVDMNTILGWTEDDFTAAERLVKVNAVFVYFIALPFYNLGVYSIDMCICAT
jgi:hypothetical protein